MPAGALAAKGATGKAVGAHLLHRIVVETIINGTIMASIKAVGYHGAAYMWAGLLGAAVGAPVGVVMGVGAVIKANEQFEEQERENTLDLGDVCDEEEQASRTAGACCFGTVAGATASVYCVDLCLPICALSNILVQTLVVRELSCQAAPLCGVAAAAGCGGYGGSCAGNCHRRLKSKPSVSQTDEEKQEMLEKN
eukprot:TRINITY_DN17476_c0_g1_i1.p1 TRINITY_DN17476_c0_g1~~TRINITY_DN17476_c0_g1_i1.p1  ORF type:complete len:195 (+),score=32.56 TRINITY_DN17476_c0_g1_i1:37-621(+)